MRLMVLGIVMVIMRSIVAMIVGVVLRLVIVLGVMVGRVRVHGIVHSMYVNLRDLQGRFVLMVRIMIMMEN